MTKRQIAWTVLDKGHDIVGSDGSKIGTVKDVVGDVEKDIFSGITFSPGLTQDAMFIPADRVAEITREAVHLSITSDEAGDLEPYED